MVVGDLEVRQVPEAIAVFLAVIAAVGFVWLFVNVVTGSVDVGVWRDVSRWTVLTVGGIMFFAAGLAVLLTAYMLIRGEEE